MKSVFCKDPHDARTVEHIRTGGMTMRLLLMGFLVLVLAGCGTGLVGSGPITLSPGCQQAFADFKSLDNPGYFAVATDGRACGWSYCDDISCLEVYGEVGAINSCERRSKIVPCKTYAFKEKVVWKKTLLPDVAKAEPRTTVFAGVFAGDITGGGCYGFGIEINIDREGVIVGQARVLQGRGTVWDVKGVVHGDGSLDMRLTYLAPLGEPHDFGRRGGGLVLIEGNLSGSRITIAHVRGWNGKRCDPPRSGVLERL